MKEKVTSSGLKNKSMFNGSIPICGKASRKYGMEYYSFPNKPFLISTLPLGCYRNIKRNSPYYGTNEISAMPIKHRPSTIRLSDKGMMIV